MVLRGKVIYLFRRKEEKEGGGVERGRRKIGGRGAITFKAKKLCECSITPNKKDKGNTIK